MTAPCTLCHQPHPRTTQYYHRQAGTRRYPSEDGSIFLRAECKACIKQRDYAKHLRVDADWLAHDPPPEFDFVTRAERVRMRRKLTAIAVVLLAYKELRI